MISRNFYRRNCDRQRFLRELSRDEADADMRDRQDGTRGHEGEHGCSS